MTNPPAFRLLCFMTLLLGAAAHAGAGDAEAQTSIAVVGGTLLDGTGAPPVSDAVVVIRDGKVVCAGTGAACPLEADAHLLDASGRWVIPGLIDSHIHWQIWYDQAGQLAPEAAAQAGRVYLANGVTTVVDVGGQRWVRPEHRAVLDRLAVNGDPVPRMLHSAWIDGRTLDQAEASNAGELTRSLLDSDAVGMKIHNGLTMDDVEAIARESHRAGRPVYGHTYFQDAGGFLDYTPEAVRAGVDGIFHVLGFPPVPEGTPLPDPDIPDEDWETWWLAGADLWNRVTDESMDALIRLMVEHGAWLQPTLVTEEWIVVPEYFRAEDAWRYSPMTWEELNMGSPEFVGEELEVYRAAYGQMKRFVRRFADQGGMLVAGTDGLPVPGFGVQEEMRLLVQAGVPPMEALRAATRNAAVAWRWDDRIGTLEAGKEADLVILKGDPLEDIRNTRRIWRVLKGGTVYDPGVLLR
jgi:imidazolonepropionase-like amidohydrolase